MRALDARTCSRATMACISMACPDITKRVSCLVSCRWGSGSVIWPVDEQASKPQGNETRSILLSSPHGCLAQCIVVVQVKSHELRTKYVFPSRRGSVENYRPPPDGA